MLFWPKEETLASTLFFKFVDFDSSDIVERERASFESYPIALGRCFSTQCHLFASVSFESLTKVRGISACRIATCRRLAR